MTAEYVGTTLLLEKNLPPDRSLRRRLERCACFVVEVSSAEEARRLLSEGGVALLVADALFASPRETAEILRSLLAVRPVPLLLVFPSSGEEITDELAVFAQSGFVTQETPESLLRVAIHNSRRLFEIRMCPPVKRTIGQCAACGLRERCELRMSEERFRSLVANIPGVVFRCRSDPEWTMLYMSDLVEELTGYPKEDFIENARRSYVTMIHPEDVPSVARRITEAIGRRLSWEIEYRVLRKDGGERWVYEKGVPVFDEDGALLFLDGFIFDITGRKRVDDQLNSERKRLANVIEGANAGTWECNLQTGETLLNDKLLELLGHAPGDLDPVTMDVWLSLLHPEDLGQVGDILAGHVRGELENYDHEVRMQHRDGHWVWMHCKGRIISRTPDGEPLWMYGTYIDVTDRKQAEKELLEANRRLLAMQKVLKREATRDSLTGVLNRRAILEHLNEELARCRRDGTCLSAAICDIDHFKEVNDTYGHQTGDDVLCGLVRLLRSNLREYDKIGRIGGEEFLLVLPGEAGRSAGFHERLVKSVAEHSIQTRSGAVRITLSLGAITVSGDADTDEILARADKAMYKAKAEGRNRVVFISDAKAP